MTSPVPLVIALLKAAPAVTARVGARIDPEMVKDTDLPRIVVRQASGREVYGLARAAGLREAQVTVLCAASTYTAADSLAETVREALKDVRHARVAQHRVTVMQNGEDIGSATEDGAMFQRVTGYRVSVAALR